MTFVLQMISALAEPIGMAGYVLCGIFLPRLWMALPVAAGWAVLMQVWDASAQRARFAVFNPELFVPRIAVALIVAAVVFYLAEAWHARRAARTAPPRANPPPNPPASGGINPS